MKMYLVTKTLYTMFVSDSKKKFQLELEGEQFLEEEDANRNRRNTFKVIIKEIKSMSEVPEDWKSGPIMWGQEKDDLTPEEFLKEQTKKSKSSSKEYKEYLRLKAKFD